MNSNPIHEEVYKDHTIKIFHDSDPPNPRTDSQIGKMICFHGRYSLGDKHDYKQNDYDSWAGLKKSLIKDFRNDVVLPIYLYDHSGITVNTTGFHCPWDSGQVGFIIVDRKQLFECRGTRKITKKEKAILLQQLEEEVTEYDNYLTDNCHGYTIHNKEGEETASCWGFLGDSSTPLEEAKQIVDFFSEVESTFQ